MTWKLIILAATLVYTTSFVFGRPMEKSDKDVKKENAEPLVNQADVVVEADSKHIDFEGKHAYYCLI